MLLVILPLMGFFLSYLYKKFGIAATCTILILNMLGAACISIFIFTEVVIKQQIIIYNINWISLEQFNLKYTFLFDPISGTMGMLIAGITSLVMVYSYNYLHNDARIVTFLSYLSLFCFTMLVMVTAGNFVQLFIGWEGVGLASYFLITFWKTRNDANVSAIKAILVNRIGDISFIVALGFIWCLFKSFDFGVINILASTVGPNNITIELFGKTCQLLTLICFSLMIAGCVKSAQIMFHTWLPDAMEGPTPVSSLLHSATMVTAGVFLLIRSSFILINSALICIIMLCMGTITALVAGIINTGQTDIKKIVAYSTCSQLGYMMIATALGLYNYAFYHLILHAMYKCLLFLCSGCLIHLSANEQDARSISSGVLFYSPLTYSIIFLANGALMGGPGLAGFFSKDAIIEVGFIINGLGYSLYALLTFASLFTSIYSGKVFSAYFSTEQRSINASGGKDLPLFMFIPTIILVLCIIFVAFFAKEMFIGPIGLDIFGNSMAISGTPMEELEFTSDFQKWVPIIGFLIGICSNYIIDQIDSFDNIIPFKRYHKFFYFLFASRFGFDFYYNLLATAFTTFTAYIQFKVIDRGLLENYGPKGFSYFFGVFAKLLQGFHRGFLNYYIMFLLSATVIFVFFTLYI